MWPTCFKMKSFKCYLIKLLPCKDPESKFKAVLKDRRDHYLQKNERMLAYN